MKFELFSLEIRIAHPKYMQCKLTTDHRVYQKTVHYAISTMAL
jgi:hypothetical protein